VSADLVKKLRGIAISKENTDFAYGRKAPLYGKETEIEWEAANRIEALEALTQEMRKAFIVMIEGDYEAEAESGRSRIAVDRMLIAINALSKAKSQQEGETE